MPASLDVKADLKREIAIYNNVRANVMQGMKFLIQSQVPIARPDDFFAEMLKSDGHMKKIKGRLLQQQSRIKAFEEKKGRAENKKFHKALKDHKMRTKHAEKKENLKNIEKLKKRVSQKGGDQMDDKEFDRIMATKPGQEVKKAKKGNTLDVVRDKQRKSNQFKAKTGGKGKQKVTSHLRKKQAEKGKKPQGKRTIGQKQHKASSKRR